MIVATGGSRSGAPCVEARKYVASLCGACSPWEEEIGVSLYRSTSLPNIFCVLTILPPRKLWFSSPSSAPLSTGSRGYHPPFKHRRSSIMTGCNLPLRRGKCKTERKTKTCALKQRIHPHLGNNLWAPSSLSLSFNDDH